MPPNTVIISNAPPVASLSPHFLEACLTFSRRHRTRDLFGATTIKPLLHVDSGGLHPCCPPSALSTNTIISTRSSSASAAACHLPPLTPAKFDVCSLAGQHYRSSFREEVRICDWESRLLTEGHWCTHSQQQINVDASMLLKENITLSLLDVWIPVIATDLFCFV
ncbi:hypothetical protein GALMADRAFT_139708 [Galerina marginata CBS 339.88]|uniref:Uncharacterized protein n=1 Tax=Galerina marginata (strain CBS 339.88) TaxID=685588 RepID=A0A067TAC0_GALM3|nr:hypothetical protein GALMADRAFT_139708 [Galerina marginata CBS 339.88]